MWLRSRIVRTSCGRTRTGCHTNDTEEHDGFQGEGRRIQPYSCSTVIIPCDFRPAHYLSPNGRSSLAGGCSSSVWNITCWSCTAVLTHDPFEIRFRSPPQPYGCDDTRSVWDQVQNSSSTIRLWWHTVCLRLGSEVLLNYTAMLTHDPFEICSDVLLNHTAVLTHDPFEIRFGQFLLTIHPKRLVYHRPKSDISTRSFDVLCHESV